MTTLPNNNTHPPHPNIIPLPSHRGPTSTPLTCKRTSPTMASKVYGKIASKNHEARTMKCGRLTHAHAHPRSPAPMPTLMPTPVHAHPRPCPRPPAPMPTPTHAHPRLPTPTPVKPTPTDTLPRPPRTPTYAIDRCALCMCSLARSLPCRVPAALAILNPAVAGLPSTPPLPPIGTTPYPCGCRAVSPRLLHRAQKPRSPALVLAFRGASLCPHSEMPDLDRRGKDVRAHIAVWVWVWVWVRCGCGCASASASASACACHLRFPWR